MKYDDAFLKLLEKTLDDKQYKALTQEGNTVIAAGAGSGKTQVLATRFAWLVLTGQAEAPQILTLTFTNKAASEMYQRIYDTLKYFSEHEECKELSAIQIQRAKKALEDFSDTHIQTLDFSWYDGVHSGNVMTLLTSDLDKVRHFVAWVLYQILENSLIYIFSIIVLSSINWKLTLAFMVIAPPVLFLVQKFKIHIRPAHLAVRDQFAALNTRVGENIEGNRVVKAFVREGYEISRFDEENEKYKDVAVNNADVRVKYTPWIEALTGILPVILILFGGYLVMKQEITIGQLVTFNGLMWAFTQPINMFGTLVDNMQNFGASQDRLYELWCVYLNEIHYYRKLDPFRKFHIFLTFLHLLTFLRSNIRDYSITKNPLQEEFLVFLLIAHRNISIPGSTV